MAEEPEKEVDISELKDLLRSNEITADERYAIEQAIYRLEMLNYVGDDPFLSAHMFSKVEEAFSEKGIKIPDEIKDALEKKSLSIRQAMEKKLLEKKKEYASLLQSKKNSENSSEKKHSEMENMANSRKDIFNSHINNDNNDKPEKYHISERQKAEISFSDDKYIDYEECLQFLDSIEKKKGIKLGLDNMSKILQLLGSPQSNYKIIHVAGTNGKGSVCAMIDSILQSAGLKTGRYTSPHLVKINERFMINGEQISDEKFVEMVNRIRPYLKKVELTYFEILTLMAFIYFNDEKVNFAVVEVGMGGRLDATNASLPFMGVITNIDLDHTEHLGNTIKEIAAEKAGIIKEGMMIVTGCEGDAFNVVRDTCTRKKAKLFPLVKSQTMQDGLKFGDMGGINLLLQGDFQIKNAEVAVSSILALKNKGIQIPDRAVKIGLASADWPGRLDFVENNILLDSAHNPAGIKVLRDELEKLKKDFNSIILIFGAMKDKNIPEMILRLVPSVDSIYLTKANNERAELPENILKEVEKYQHKYIITKSVNDALEKARALATPRELIVVTGSIYVVGEAMAYLQGRNIF